MARTARPMSPDERAELDRTRQVMLDCRGVLAELVERIRSLRASGVPAHQISAELGLSSRAVDGIRIDSAPDSGRLAATLDDLRAATRRRQISRIGAEIAARP